MRLGVGASGAEKLCALGAMGRRSCAAPQLPPLEVMMHTPWCSLFTARSLLALALGLVAFVGLSLLRIQIQYAFHPAAVLGALLTVLMYVLPGALVALLVPQFRLLHGAVLGLLTVFVVWFEVPLRSAQLSCLDVAQFIVLASLFGAGVSLAGSGAAQWAIQRMTSNNRWRVP